MCYPTFYLMLHTAFPFLYLSTFEVYSCPLCVIRHSHERKYDSKRLAVVVVSIKGTHQLADGVFSSRQLHASLILASPGLFKLFVFRVHCCVSVSF